MATNPCIAVFVIGSNVDKGLVPYYMKFSRHVNFANFAIQKIAKLKWCEQYLFYFISLASPKKQTNRQTERTLAGTPQQLWPITAGPEISVANITWRKNQVTDIMSIIKKEQVYYHWSVYNITFFTFLGNFQCKWMFKSIDSRTIVHVQAWTACGHSDNCFVVTVNDIWNKSYMNCGNEMKMKKWSSQSTQFMQLHKEAWKKKKSGLQRGFNPWPLDYRCDALPTELWSHWRWEQVRWLLTLVSLLHFSYFWRYCSFDKVIIFNSRRC